MATMLYVLLGVLLLLLFRVIARMLFQYVTIIEYQSGLKYRNGKYVGILSPGKYLIYKLSTRVLTIDTRPVFATVSGQEVLSSDGITLKISLAMQYKIDDPNKAINSVQNYQEALYIRLQMALREIVGSKTIDELLEKRNELGSIMADKVADSLKDIGLTLIDVNIKDIMLPGEVKKLFQQIVKARKEGQAIMEKARGETAALRNLANAAEMIQEHPCLLQLRALQQLGESTGNTLVLGLAEGVPIQKKAQGINSKSD